MTSPTLSSSVCSVWLPPGSSPETSAAARLDPHLRPACDGLHWAAEAAGSALAAFAAQPETTVKVLQSELVGVERSDGCGQGAGVAGASGGGHVDGGAHSEHEPGRGCGGGGGRGAGSHGVGPVGAGEGASAGDGALPAPAVMTSSPSCDPWCSCCRWRWLLGGA